MTELIIDMAGTAEAIPETADCVARFSVSVGLDQEAAHQIRIVLSEALNNIISYALLFDRRERIRIECREEEDTLKIGICDHGLPLRTSSEYSCPKPGDPCPDGCTPCGRGWPIILRWADSVDYRRQGSHNMLTLHRKLTRTTRSAQTSSHRGWVIPT